MYDMFFRDYKSPIKLVQKRFERLFGGVKNRRPVSSGAHIFNATGIVPGFLRVLLTHRLPYYYRSGCSSMRLNTNTASSCMLKAVIGLNSCCGSSGRLVSAKKTSRVLTTL